MRIGICAFLDRLNMIGEGIGDYVEFPLSEIHRWNREEMTEAKEQLSRIGVKAETANGFFPGKEIMMCGPLYDIKRIVEYSKEAFDKALEFDIRTVVLGSAGARSVDDTSKMDECMKQIKESILTVGDVAKEMGVEIVLECLNRNETNTINKIAEGAKIVRELSHPSVKLLADIFHYSVEEEAPGVIYENGDILRHVHIANPKTRFLPLPDDGIDYTTIKDTLLKAGYSGRISIEAICNPESYPADIVKSYNYLKKVFA